VFVVPSGSGPGRLRETCVFASAVLLSLSACAWAQDPSPDRMVAEWMLRMGGSVILEGQRRPFTDLADLPTSDFRVRTLNFTGITQWGSALEDELRRLPALPHLKELYVNGRLWYRSEEHTSELQSPS